MLRRNLLLGFAALLTLGGSQARADILLELAAGSPTAVGSNFLYTYNVSLQPNSSLVPAGGGLNTSNLFTIYDFNGYVPGTAALGTLTGFSVSVQTPGITPATQIPPDTTVVNITFTDVSNVSSNPGPAVPPLLLGTVTLQSTFPLGTRSTFYSAATQDSDLPGSVIANNTNQVLGPAVPEPASVALLGTGLVVVLGLGLRRTKKV